MIQKFKIVDLKQGTPEWLAYRKKKRTATDVAAIMGHSPYQTALEVYSEKLSKKIKPIDPEKEFIFSLGHKTEEAARTEYSLITGAEMRPICVESTVHESLFASLDGLYEEENRAIEVKLVGKDALEKAKDHTLPMSERLHYHHYLQIQAQLLVLDSNEMDIFYVDPKKNKVILTVSKDVETQEKILLAVREFNQRINDKNPPPMTEADTLEIVSGDLKKKFKQLSTLKRKLDSIQASYDAIEKEIKSNPPHVRVACAGIALTKVVRAGSVDYKKVPELKGVDLEQYRGAPITSWRLTFPSQEKRA